MTMSGQNHAVTIPLWVHFIFPKRFKFCADQLKPPDFVDLQPLKTKIAFRAMRLEDVKPVLLSPIDEFRLLSDAIFRSR
jgi:hypothetical protein